MQPPETFLKDLKNGELPAVSWLIPPEGQPERAPGLGHERLRRRELDRSVRERADAERVLADAPPS